MPIGRDVKRHAREAGFDLCGIAAAVPGEEDARLQEWLANGYHGDMKYMERRKDVRDLLPGCKAVIALGVNYYVKAEHDRDPARPRISPPVAPAAPLARPRRQR